MGGKVGRIVGTGAGKVSNAKSAIDTFDDVIPIVGYAMGTLCSLAVDAIEHIAKGREDFDRIPPGMGSQMVNGFCDGMKNIPDGPTGIPSNGEIGEAVGEAALDGIKSAVDNGIGW